MGAAVKSKGELTLLEKKKKKSKQPTKIIKKNSWGGGKGR